MRCGRLNRRGMDVLPGKVVLIHMSFCLRSSKEVRGFSAGKLFPCLRPLPVGAVILMAAGTVSAQTPAPVAFETNYNNSVSVTALFLVPSLFFTGPGFFTNQAFRLGFSGFAGSNCVLQATTNFVTGTPLSMNLAPSNLFNLFDLNATHFRYRFYRVPGQ